MDEYLQIKVISKKTKIGVSTLTTILCRPEFNKYMYNPNSQWHKYYKYDLNFLKDLYKFFLLKNNTNFMEKIIKAIRNKNNEINSNGKKGY